MNALILKRKITLKDLRSDIIWKEEKRVPNVLAGEISTVICIPVEKRPRKIPPDLAKLSVGSVVYRPDPEEEHYPYIFIQLSSEKRSIERYSVKKDLFN
ncbi:MAG: hypothetical protein JWM92_44 [Candidatus Nomurabacteria bacterium]|nr:hypothetical protein [Candidatus Nomurabacteria bacterium]